jgi:PAS domain S-box-containing protein
MQFISSYKAEREQGHNLVLMQMLSVWSKTIEGPFRRLTVGLHQLVQYQEEQLKVDPEAEARSHESMKKFVELGVLINIIIAIALSLIVTVKLTRRIEDLMANTKRLSRGEPLLPLKPGTDEIAQLDKVFHDMANDLQHEKEMLQLSEERIREIVETTLVGLISIDERGVIEQVNKSAESLFGTDASKLIGQSASELLPALGTKANFVEKIKEKALGQVVETMASRRNGDRFPVEVTVTKFSSGNEERYLFNVLDITQRYEVEQLKKDFVAMVSHDLRTPLTSLLSSLTLLSTGSSGRLDAQSTKIVASAEDELTRLIRLINDLLDVAKMEAGKLELQLDGFEVSSIVSAAVNAVSGLAKVKEISIDVVKTKAEIVADKDRVVQVLVNLLSNAIKFSPQGGSIQISVEETADWLELSVIDHGPGIPRDSRDLIFERFKQLKGAAALDVSVGSGLGLAICKKIVQAHSGSIGVDSKEGEGSRFWFRIPCNLRPASVVGALIA